MVFQNSLFVSKKDLSFLVNIPKQLSRQESLSSLSADSLGSIEQEQALLEQCISSGMPKSKHTSTPNKLETNKSGVSVIKPIGVATKQFNTSKPKNHEEKHKTYGERNRDFDIQEEKKNSKNVNVTSAAGSTTTETSPVRPTTPTTVAGVEHIENIERNQNLRPTIAGMRVVDTSRDKCSPSEENLSTELTKNGCDKSLGQILNNSCEENCLCKSCYAIFF